MKTLKVVHIVAGIGLLTISALVFSSFSSNKKNKATYRTTYRSIPKGCVFRTLMGEESSDSNFVYKTPQKVAVSIEKGLTWIVKAQHPSGGWGAGSHSRQDVMDPHAVQADPATTSMVAMALLRTGTTLNSGLYAQQLTNAVNYILKMVESSDRNSNNITDQTGTQIQIKLGQNIDVILAAQFLSNLLPYLDSNPQLKARAKKDLEICVSKIQHAQSKDGSISGSGWAGVLQSSFATNALESAQAQGATVDNDALTRARDFQKGNYDARTGAVNTEMGAGVMLYSVTGSARASAKEARKVEEELTNAKKAGRLDQNAPATSESLEKIGYSKDDAMKYSTAYNVYNSAKVQAQREDVMDGFGSNGGEEFLSYLQTGESMIIGKDNGWNKWYDNMSGRVLRIQNDDGSWSGHHCITSPVFCTATSLLILSINNDADKLTELGK
ncbi:squalene--hopene cyclase [Cytophagales bacterium WSM2-2]|nr:squalene--hopene cyclase [Cytophagales bacterium WSM2-2]